jgi:hypothetical protein
MKEQGGLFVLTLRALRIAVPKVFCGTQGLLVWNFESGILDAATGRAVISVVKASTTEHTESTERMVNERHFKETHGRFNCFRRSARISSRRERGDSDSGSPVAGIRVRFA